MVKHIVFTFLGEDKPGLIQRLAGIVVDHQGNWLESNMSQLAGKFAGIVLVAVSTENQGSLTKALQDLHSEGLQVYSEESSSSELHKGEELKLSIMGPDRAGIVHSVTQALGLRHINVKDMESRISSAAMSGDPMFEAEAVVQVKTGTDLDDLATDLDNISVKLGIDIELV